MNLYLTADQIGTPTGGGVVTYHELEALKSLGNTKCFHRDNLGAITEDPWGWDRNALHLCHTENVFLDLPKLLHVYAGTFSDTVRELKSRGTIVTYTAAAHDIKESRREHEELGIPYNYPHITDPELWKRYVAGYLEANCLICPSVHSANVMRGFGYEKRIVIIPHGCDFPKTVVPQPKRFTVGYLGSYGPDKGVRYLLEAWKKLNYKDATLLLAGRDSTSDFVTKYLIPRFGGGNIELMGWVNNVSDFYNRISVYCQPSVTEGFGIEVLEAMAYERVVICSQGAGACDLVPLAFGFPACDVDLLIEQIEDCKKCRFPGTNFRKIAENYTWDKIRQMYITLWKELLA